MSKYLAEVYDAQAKRFFVGVQGKKKVFRKEVSFFIPLEPTTYAEDTRTQNWRFVKASLEKLINTGFAIIATPEQPLRLPSGGCLDVIFDASGRVFIAMEKRDEKPDIRAPGFWNPFLGYPASLEECLSRNHIKRESIAEGIFSRKFVPIVVVGPEAEGIYVSRKDIFQQRILVPSQEFEKEVAIKTAKKLSLDPRPERLEKLTMRYNERKARDVYSLYWDLEERAGMRCWVTWWPTPDIIMIREIHLPVTMEEVIIYQEKGREILVVEREELKGKKFGDEVSVLRNVTRDRDGKRIVFPGRTIFKPTSSLKGALHCLGIYPKDWVKDTMELLSNDDYTNLLEENPGADPFRLEGILWEMHKHP